MNEVTVTMKDKTKFGLIVLAIAALLAVAVLAAAPAWDFSSGNFNLQEDSGTASYDLRTFAIDPENDLLTFALDPQSNASVISCALAADGFTLNCTTAANQSGTNTVQVTVNDSEVPANSVTDSFTLTVDPVNDAPVINTAPTNKEAVEGVLFSHTLPATSISDVDNVVADLSVDPTSLPAWLSVDAQNLLKFSGTPTSSELNTGSRARVYAVNLQITDGEASNSLSAAAPFNITVKPALEIDRDSLEILVSQEAFTADEQINVSPGDTVTVSYTFANNFNKQLGSVQKEAQVIAPVGMNDFVDRPIATEWAMFSGEVEDDQFTFTVPLDITGNTFTVQLQLSHNSFKGNFQNTEELVFTIVREEADIEISSATLADNTLSCNRVTDLSITATNTGDNAVTPQLLVYDEEQFEFDADAGEFAGEELLNQAFPTLQPATTATAPFSLNLTGLSSGQNTLFVYLVNPDFTDFQGSAAEVPLTVSNCLTTFSPMDAEQLIRPNTALTFRTSVMESTFKQFLKWYVDGTQAASKVTALTRTLSPGQHTVEVRLQTNQGLQESHSWEVTVTGRPLTDNFELPGFDESKNLASYTDFTVENNAGSVTFDEAVDLTNVFTLDDIMVITHTGNLDVVSVDTAAAPGLAGRSATVTLPHTFTNPLILKAVGFADEQNLEFTECTAPACTVVQNTAGEFVFQVDSFSTYVVLEEVPAALSVLPAEITFDNVVAGQVANTTITIMNSGTFDPLTGLSVQLLNVSPVFNAQVSGTLPSTLNPGETVTPSPTLSLTIPAGEPAGKHQIGTLRVTSSAGTDDTPIFINPKSFLTVKSVKINGKSDGKFQLDEPTTVDVEVKNDHTQDMENIVVTVTLKNINDEEVEEESEEFDLDNGDDEKVELDFDLRNEDVENEQFTMEIVLEGEDESGTMHRTLDTRTVQLDLENHNVMVKSAVLESASLQCQRNTVLRVTVQNIGKSDENDVEIHVRNTALGLNLVKLGIELDDFASVDNEHQALGTVNAENAPAGQYPITVEVYRDGKLEDTEEVVLEVKGCALGAATVAPAPTTTTPSGQQKEVVIDVASQKLAQELQQQLAARKAVLEQPIVSAVSFRESSLYLPLLGVFVVLVFLAVVLGLIVMVTRK